MTSGKFLILSEPQFPNLQNGDNSSTDLICLFGDELMDMFVLLGDELMNVY